MIAVVSGSVLQARPRVAQDGKQYVDLYLLQEGERQPVVAYAEVADLPLLPVPGDVVEATCQIWASKYAGGALSVKVTAVRPVYAAA